MIFAVCVGVRGLCFGNLLIFAYYASSKIKPIDLCAISQIYIVSHCLGRGKAITILAKKRTVHFDHISLMPKPFPSGLVGEIVEVCCILLYGFVFIDQNISMGIPINFDTILCACGD